MEVLPAVLMFRTTPILRLSGGGLTYSAVRAVVEGVAGCAHVSHDTNVAVVRREPDLLRVYDLDNFHFQRARGDFRFELIAHFFVQHRLCQRA